MSDSDEVSQASHLTIIPPNYSGKGYPPYGYWHIRKVYADGSWWIQATVDGQTPVEQVQQIAHLLAEYLKVAYGTESSE